MSTAETDAFLREFLPGWMAAEHTLHMGDATPRFTAWSHRDPVTLFGAVMSSAGWDGARHVFESIADSFSDCTSCAIELVAADASGDLAYTVMYEHTSCSTDGEPHTYILRVTQVYRREDGAWKVVHRHGDALTENQALLPGERHSAHPTNVTTSSSDAREVR